MEFFGNIKSYISPRWVQSSGHALGHQPIRPSFYNQLIDDFVVIAHRGASYYAPENTMSAFAKAVEMKADMIELDITLTQDGEVVVLHDENVKRTTNGAGIARTMTLKELQALDAGLWFSEKFRGERIPTLEEVLKWVKGKVSLNIEIKPEAVTDDVEGGIEEKSLQLVEKYGMEKHVIFSCFDLRAVDRVKKSEPRIAAAVLYHYGTAGKKGPIDLVNSYRADGFNIDRRYLSNRWINELNEQNISVWVYTVNKESHMRSLIKRGVSGIFTDRPDLLRTVAKEGLNT